MLLASGDSLLDEATKKNPDPSKTDQGLGKTSDQMGINLVGRCGSTHA